MAIDLMKLQDGTLEVIASCDGAIKGTDADSYQEYLKTLDKSHLKFVEGEQPTLFIMRKILPYGISQKIKNMQMRMEKGEMHVQFGFISEEVRAALVDIKNPENVPEASHIKFKRGSDGNASEELIAMLDSVGIVGELFAARKNYMENSSEEKNLKKN